LSKQTPELALLEATDRLAGANVGVVGDLLADLYVRGQSDRVSREAPVLILQYEEEWLRPGGAANVAYNVAALGANVHMVGLIGDDETGRRLIQELENSPNGTVHCDSAVIAPQRSTITKTRFLAGARSTSRQQVLRLDRAPIEQAEAALIEILGERVVAVDRQVDAWVVSDYGYGSFNDALRDLLRNIAAHKPVVADSRRDLHRFTGMTLIKPNEEEAAATAGLLGLGLQADDAFASALASRLEARAALVTMGNRGMVLAVNDQSIRIPAVGTEEIVDLTGAGDSVSAVLAAALAGGNPIETAARLANHAGGIVVMKEGAATASTDELRKSIAPDEGVS